jgi:aryl-alcohol dehydrogenase-like predicted oxidoreductase
VPLGVSVSGTSQAQTLDQALSLELFSAVQATWNLYERAAEPALERAHAAGLTVYVKEGLANGRLVRERALGSSPDAAALAAILAKPWADVVLSGAATVETLQSNLRALEVSASSDFDSLREDSAAYWAYRGTLPWN